MPYRDVEVVDIVRPRLDGVFSSEEEVVARVRNNGSDSAYVVVTLDVNGRHAGSRVPSSVLLYPNPSDGFFTVELAEPARIEVCDMAGCRIHEEECAVAGKYEIDLRGRASGMFLIRIVFDGGVSTHKLLIK